MSVQFPNSDPENLFWNIVINDDEKAFGTLFGLFYPSLAVFARRYINDRTVCEDLVQDVFATLWENRKKISIKISVRNYLITAVRNCCLNYLRKEGHSRDYQEFVLKKHELRNEDEEDIYLINELYELLENALAKLPEPYRIVFEMHSNEGKNYEEIAESLNISVRTAKRYKSQVMDTLKNELKDYLPLILLFSGGI